MTELDGYGFTEKFAAPLYDMLYAMYSGINIDQHWELNKDAILPFSPNQVTVRKAFQTLGTEWGRDVLGNNIWSNLLCARIAEFPNIFDPVTVANAVIAVSDCRFINEITTVRERFTNVEVWAVIRKAATPQLSHRSEQEVERMFTMANKIIDNNGSLEDLERAVKQALAVKK